MMFLSLKIGVGSQVKQFHSSESLISANLLRPQFRGMQRLQNTCSLHLSQPSTSPPLPHHLQYTSLPSSSFSQSPSSYKCLQFLHIGTPSTGCLCMLLGVW